ncbi:hypothetical protein BDV3_006204 [Batrachochytrium dendrobatidis]|uniref:Rapamycin-insensitive companion of mTOR N-terminal domain-containing protein n=2 Tax=Batrachochytrium dendrobatidis (strain JEL423) TaxID=403673 RepID=A0A177WMT1_BATDL|nr:hypothetical protein BDEG_25026 [Batrachochytrium dendrobatidis JEL423]
MDDLHSQILAATSLLLETVSNLNESAQTRLDALTKTLTILDLVKKTNSGSGPAMSVLFVNSIIKSIRGCLGDSAKEIRIVAYKILRTLISASTITLFFVNHHIDIFIIRTLIRDTRYDSEREQAIRFIRAYLDEPEGANIIPMSIIRAIVAIAEQIDDKFRSVCLETICELAICNPELTCLSGGTKVMLAALLDGPTELIDPIVASFLYLLDTCNSRAYIRTHVELETIISQFSDAYTCKTGYSIDRLTCCAAVLRKFFSSWTGLVYFCIDNLRPVRSIVEALGLPNDDTRKALLGLFFDLFQVSRSNTLNATHTTTTRPAIETIHLVSHFEAVLLMVLVRAGLIEALIELSQDPSKSISQSAITLLTSILEICVKKLPEELSTKIQSLPSLFRLACNFNDEARRHLASSRLAQILGISKARIDTKPYTKTELCYHSENRKFDSIKAHVGLQIDEIQLRIMLNDSEVIGVKDSSKWNWDIIEEIVSGPLLNSKRFDDLIRNTKFVGRLLSFYRPSTRQFCDLPKNAQSTKILSIGIDFIRNLTTTSDGARLLAESRLLVEIAEQFSQLSLLGQGQSSIPPDNIFLKQHFDETMSSNMFSLVRAYSYHPYGMRLLEQSSIYSIYYQLADMRGREDISNAILTSMDFSRDGHPRIILSKILTAGSKSLRHAATVYLDQLAQLHKDTFYEWGIPLLVTQLSDPTQEIVGAAVCILQRHCIDHRNIIAFVRTKPDIQQLTVLGNTLLIQSLAVPAGFKYLFESGYLDTETDYWFEYGNVQFVTHAELSISEGLVKGLSKSGFDTFDKDLVMNLQGYLPIQLYGELAKTTEGCAYLASTKHVSEFISQLKSHDDMVTTPAGIMKLKAAIWALGAIGASVSGRSLLVCDEAISLITSMLKSSSVLSVRGTCFYALCVISHNFADIRIMNEIGWSGDLICVPNEPSSILNLPEWNYSGSWPAQQKITFKPLHYKLDALEDEILKCIGNLSNHILATAASKQLALTRQQHPHLFTRPELCVQAWRICTLYHYRVATRRYIQELFERVVFDKSALSIVDKMAGLQLIHIIDEEESARLNENTFKSSLSLLPRDSERKGSPATHSGNKLILPAAHTIRGFDI